MKKLSAFVLTMLLLAGCGENKIIEDTAGHRPIHYPETKTVHQVDTYFSVAVADPYRWLENDTSSQTKAWVDSQNNATFSYLSGISFRGAIKDRLQKVMSYDKKSNPYKKGDYYYYSANDGTQNQDIVYQTKDLSKQGKEFFNPNTWNSEGTSALKSHEFSKDGKYWAFAISDAGSDWQTFYVKNMQTGEMLSDEVKWSKFSGIAWWRDGFFYSGYEVPEGAEYSDKNENIQVRYHKIGTEQKEDMIVYQDKENPLRYLFPSTTEDESFLTIQITVGTHGEQYLIADLRNAQLKSLSFHSIVDDFESDYSFVGNEGDDLYIKTNYQADNYRLMKCEFPQTKVTQWKEVIPNHSSHVLRNVVMKEDMLALSYMQDASEHLYYCSTGDFALNEIELPTLGKVQNFNFIENNDQKTLYYNFSSFIYPPEIYSFDVSTGNTEVFFKTNIDFDPMGYTVEQVFYKSKDGTSIPMFLVHKKGLEKNANNLAFLYGYGGFNISILPGFKSEYIPLLEQGGILAVANLRGGGEYGEKWHKDGMLLNKQNVFDDFISAGEFLVENQYTKPEKLTICGRSNGGLLVGACMTQRPDLFAVALPGVGVLDMLRYHTFTVGWGWAVEYGSSEDSVHFHNLLQYSPLHNIKEGVEYPATMVTTADHDDRVVPAHSFKFISELQKKHSGDNPVLIRIDVDAGHGSGKPLNMRVEEWADIWSFVFENTESDYTSEVEL